MNSAPALPRGGIWIDVQGAQSVAHPERGIARYVAEHTKAIASAAPEALGRVCLDPSLPLPVTLEGLAGHTTIDSRPAQAARIDETPAIYHVMSPFELAVDSERMWPSPARRPGVRTAVTLYDLIPLVFRERYLDPSPLLHAQYFARLGLIGRADRVFTISQWTANDATEHLGIPEDRITVIDCGVSPTLAALVPEPDEARALVEDRFPSVRPGALLYVGGDEWRKNMEGLIRAYALLPEGLRREHQLVIVCAVRDERKRELMGFSRDLGVEPGQLVLTGYVPDRELAALYRACALFVFPSLYEGAGLPVLEAMSCDAPVAASRVSSIPEILGDLEATFDPADPADIARCLEETLSAPKRLEVLRERSKRRAAIFTWDRVARLTLEGYEKALEMPARTAPRRQRRRLAVITPWPPQASGVANHSRNLVEELSRRVDVDVIAPREPGIEFDRSLESRVRLWNEVDFDAATGLRDYDRLLYAFGNSSFHTEVLKAFLDRPGSALLHDVRLIGLYSHLSWEYPNPYWLQRKVLELYGDTVPPDELKRVWEEAVFMKHRIFMTQEVQANAEEILLHSQFQADILRGDHGTVPPPPTAVVPHGIPSPPPLRPAGRNDVGGPLVVTYGIVDFAIKRLDLLLQAFAQVRLRRPDARLVVVGQVTRKDQLAVRQASAELLIEDAVHLQGRADLEDYWERLSAADLAVQLRTGAQGGEASGAVCDCIAARVPTIVSDIGWFGELPDDVVVKTPENCSAPELAAAMASVLDDHERADEIRAAQDRYAEENSYARVAERYLELLEL